ncbi:MAG TPA: HWE histidine kinase domain-containing protein [Caulobacteraceae bacterium]|nr:HWE histidine kinase domain-containing protein [Caulobacteraceae bacterium]
MESAKAKAAPSVEPPAGRLPPAGDDPVAMARLERIAGLAARAFRAARAAIAVVEDGEPVVKARVPATAAGWPAALALRRTLTRAPTEAGPHGLRLAAQLSEPEGGVVGLLLVEDDRRRRSLSDAERALLADLAGVATDEILRGRDEAARDTLVAELDHRVKNVLAAVQSLAGQSARKASSLESFLKTFAGRLKSMASAHQLLTATRWRGAGMQNIAAAELGGLAPGQTRWHGSDVLLTPRAANAMSLALHELATNAVKFGALSTELGRVEVAWRATPAGGLSLSWIETGGPPVEPPTRRGFGSTLLEKVTGRELGGEARVEHRREGVRATLVAGASAVASQPRAAPTASPAETGAAAGASAGQPFRAGRIEGLRVLIVEDALLLALELESGLAEAGASVVGSAADVEEGLRMAALPLDAAVLDANLNGESVLPVAEALRARRIPFVFATGYGDSKFTPQGFDAPLIKKPYDVTQVAAALAEITGRLAA